MYFAIYVSQTEFSMIMCQVSHFFLSSIVIILFVVRWIAQINHPKRCCSLFVRIRSEDAAHNQALSQFSTFLFNRVPIKVAKRVYYSSWTNARWADAFEELWYTQTNIYGSINALNHYYQLHTWCVCVCCVLQKHRLYVVDGNGSKADDKNNK